MVIQLTSGDIQTLVIILGSLSGATTASIRWATTPTKTRLKNVERQVSEIYTLLIHKPE